MIKSFKKIITHNQGGQTLIDVVVALALLSSAIASAGVISTTSSQTNAEAGRRSQAMALAQREMEGLRVVRDTAQRNTGGWVALSGTSTSCSSFTVLRNAATWSIGGLAGAEGDGLVPYTASNSGENSTFETQNQGFRRLITACPATDYRQSDSTSTNPTGTLTGTASTNVYNVTVTVKWKESNGPDKQVSFRSIFSNWRQR